MKTKLLALVGLVAVGFLVMQFLGKDVKISQLWAPASGDATVMKTYLTFDNQGDSQDTLVAIQTEAAAHAVLKTETGVEGQKTVTDLKDFAIPGGQIKTFEPGGTYIVLTGLRKQLKKGDTFVLSLVFDKKGLVEDSVVVEDSAATRYEKH